MAETGTTGAALEKADAAREPVTSPHAPTGPHPVGAPHAVPTPAAPTRETTRLTLGQASAELRSTLERASDLFRVLEAQFAATASKAVAARARISELESRLAQAEVDEQALTTRLVAAEHQACRLMNLYVATYQLHATLDPSEVLATITEIATNLVGAEAFVLLLRNEATGKDEVALIEGVSSAQAALFPDGRYGGGSAMIDGALGDGLMRMAPAHSDGTGVLAAVPLTILGSVAGVLVVLKLLDHRPPLGNDDRELLDLIAAHAASALCTARLFASTDRKLRTLEGLMRLVRDR